MVDKGWFTSRKQAYMMGVKHLRAHMLLPVDTEKHVTVKHPKDIKIRY